VLSSSSSSTTVATVATTALHLLPQLQQGATLSIRSHVPVTSVRLEPAWCDSGHVTLRQVLAQHDMIVVDQQQQQQQQYINDYDQQQQQQLQQQQQRRLEMIVSQEKDQMTSLGRTASHVSLVLQPTTTTTTESTNAKPEVDIMDKEAEQQKETEPGVYLTVQIPEKLNISCDLNYGGSIFITHGKVEGDVRLITTHGNIHVQKLRGQNLELRTGTATTTTTTTTASAATSPDGTTTSNTNSSSNNNTILVSDLLEAQNLVLATTGHGGRIRVKQIHARTANITIHAAAAAAAAANASSSSCTHSLDTSTLQQDVDDEGSLIDIGSLYISAGTGAAGNSRDDGVNNNNAGGGGGGVTLSVHGPCRPPRRAVRVKSHHGALQVTTHQLYQPTETNVLTNQIYPLVELGGVNGNVEVSIRTTMMKQQQQQQSSSSSSSSPLSSNVESHENDWNETGQENKSRWTSCCVHVDSLSQDSVSLISVDNHPEGGGDAGGDISLTLDRKVEADLRLASIMNNNDCLDEVSALLAEEEDDYRVMQVLNHLPASSNHNGDDESMHPLRIDIATTAFTPLSSSPPSSSASFKSDALEYNSGWVENKSHEPDSRFERKVRGEEHASSSSGGSVGKIRIASAAEQALHGFTDIHNKTEDANTATLSSAASSYLRPLLAVVTNRGGRIKVETVSWLGAIARRYGLEESAERRRDVGRTAARRGRPFIWNGDEK
jgi:pyruvate/2-oxoglutarate dehydrogenase complex dihydrolipoamide acyltransferase (E2) component